MNVIERAGMSVRKEVIDEGDLQFSEDAGGHGEAGAPAGRYPFPDPAEGFSMEDFITAARKHLVARALEMSNGSKTEAARLLGITPQAIHNHLRREAEQATGAAPG
jgi:DNA-binding NtrC family response regulator